VHTAASTKEHGYDRVPEPSAIHYSHAPRYVHFTSNNTIFGTQWREEPDTPEGAYLACDASSDIFSRPIDLDRYGVLYAGAQKNIGPSGTVLVIARKELVAEPVRDLPTMLRYSTYAESGSLYNTPSTFGIYLVGLMFEWILEQGGLRALGKQNEEKALVLYDAIDASGYYRGAAQRESRSLMNVTFATPSAEDDAAFVEAAEAEGLSGLKGHRSVGGMRASLYNASPRSSVDALVSFMREFERSRG